MCPRWLSAYIPRTEDSGQGGEKTFDGAGQGGPTLPIDGAYSVRDVFAEMVIPIVQGKSFFEDLSLEVGFRNSTYKVAGNPT